MNDFIINVLQPQGQSIPIWIPIFGGLPYNSPLIGSFLGVALGFAVNYIWIWISDKRSGLHYIKLVKSELNQAKVTLEKDKNDELFINPLKERRPSKIQINSWTSVVNNGDLRLFDSIEIDCLNCIYSQVKEYNDEIQLYKDTSTRFGFTSGTDITKESVYYPRRKHLGELNIKLIIELCVIIKKKWISSEHWWQRVN
jgi:hypothetical protein